MYTAIGTQLHKEAIRAIKIVPEEKLPILIQFAKFLGSDKYNADDDPVSSMSLSERRKQVYGKLHGQIEIADDFNQTPECFEDYL